MTPSPSEQLNLSLSEGIKPNTTPINGRCMLRREGRVCVVSVAGLPMHQWAEGDAAAEAYARVSLVRCGYADQNEVAKAFGCSTRTLRRQEQLYERLGIEGLGRRRGRPVGTAGAADAWVQTAKALQKQGLALRTIAERLQMSVGAVSKWLNRSERSAARSASVHGPTERQEEPAARRDTSSTTSARMASGYAFGDPLDRVLDRLLARMGRMQDAEPVFVSGRGLPQAGVLLAVPALVQSGIFPVAEDVYGSIGPAFYGLRTTMMTLLIMGLLRIKRPEGLKEHLPAALGRILGLDRAPEVKTLRRKLTRLADIGKAAIFGQKLSEKRVARRGRMLGFLYVDGHVRVYHGKRKLAKAYATRLRLALPATTDYWVNDQTGDPVFVLTAELNEALTAILPRLLEEIRRLVGQKRRVTIVFDRGGWSPKLFVKILALGFDFLTYRKGPWTEIPESQFKSVAHRIEGRPVSYVLNDRNIRLMGGRLRLRQITRLNASGHQTPMVTSRRDLPAFKLAYRMFERWRQENFFKYQREEYALDALVDYQSEPENPQASVRNPDRRAFDQKLTALRLQLRHLQIQYGQAAWGKRPSKKASAAGPSKRILRRWIRRLQERLQRLKEKRRPIPARVSVKDLPGDPLLRLSRERQHLTQCIKMVAYQAESDLLALVRPRYARADQEGRTLITSALQSAADVQVGNDTLTVTLAPLSSSHRSKAIATLCQTLNKMGVCFPGTSLRLSYAVAEEQAWRQKADIS